ncbi:MAG TPA: CarD family transcriptional regulator [Candidatus Binatia bacterium]|jgi:RNA polymerase-interacting CarD/CdnL/TRCF family regulator
MKLSVGHKVVYPCQGPCRIGSVISKVVAGRPTSFYRLIVLDEKGGELFVPLDRANSLGIRQLLDKSEIAAVFRQLKTRTTADENWKQRTAYNAKLLASGSAFDLVKVIQSLSSLNTARALSPRDRQMLDCARRILIAEISEVTGVSKQATEEQVDNALGVASHEREAVNRSV